MTVTIYHNPACGTSRNVLALIRNADIEPTVIEYLKDPPTRRELLSLVRRMGLPLQAILRRKGTPFDELGLGDPGVGEAALLAAVERHPILINRPIVVTALGVRLCRPSDVVLTLLDRPQQTDFFKEDGEPVLAAHGLGDGALEELVAALSGASLPVEDLALPGRQFYRFTTALGETVGFGGVEGLGPDRLIRSFVVLPGRRGKGYGRAMAQMLERLAEEDGARNLHLLTTGAAAFFEKAGYEKRDRSEVPAAIAASEEFVTLCPGTAAYMVKPVRTSW
jgi:arsenate reductase